MSKSSHADTSIDPNLSRRDALAALGGLAAVGVLSSAAGAWQPGGSSPTDGSVAAPAIATLTAEQLGWDAAKKTFVLPSLGFADDALEPHIDAQTMKIHREAHHAAYVKGLNNALAKLAEIREGKGDVALIKHWQRELAFHGSGHANHALFWTVLAPAGKGGGGKPTGPLTDAINESFGSFDAFVTHFKAAAVAVEGGGWSWLVYHKPSQRLYVTQGESQQQMSWNGAIPILGIDVWEHAYYLKHQSKRKDYVDAFMNVINWGRVAANLAAVK